VLVELIKETGRVPLKKGLAVFARHLSSPEKKTALSNLELCGSVALQQAYTALTVC
jgi:hypothetical protein